MLKLEYFIVCQSFAADFRAQSISAFHIVNRMVIPSVPTRYAELDGISHWRGTPTEADQEIQLKVISPGGSPINEFKRALANKEVSETQIFPITNIPINSYGELVFEIWEKENILARQVVEIIEPVTVTP